MPDLVRVRINDFEKNVGRSFAESLDLEVLDEPTTNGDGSLRATTRKDGRPVKEKTTVAKKAADKKAAVTSAPNTEEK